MSIENRVVVTGLKETRQALQKFDKDAVKAFDRVLNSELKNAKADALAFVKTEPPLSGWNTQPARNPRTRGGAGWPQWDQSIIRAGITSSKAEGRVKKDYTTSVGSLKNKSAAGAIYELAGRTSRGTGTFIRNIEGKFGDASRIVWKSVDKNRDRFERNVLRALDDMKARLQRNLQKERD